MKRSKLITLFFIFTVLFKGVSSVKAEDLTRYQDQSDISQLLLKWGYFRDHGMWEELADTFHTDGNIQVTWYVGPFNGFVDASKEMAMRGVKASHVMKPSIISVKEDRAIAITPVSIIGRAKGPLGIELDMTSEAQFFDFVEKRDSIWRISRRICIYQKDRIDSTSPSIAFWLASFFMNTDDFDPAFKHLGMVLSRAGYKIHPGQVVDNTGASKALYQEGLIWLNK